MFALIDPRVWAAFALAVVIAFGAGFVTRAMNSVSNATHDKVVAEFAAAKATAEAKRATDEREASEVNRKAEIAGTALRQAEDARQRERTASVAMVTRLRSQLRAIQLPGGVRDAYDAGRRPAEAGSGTEAHPGGVRPDTGTADPAPVNAADLVAVCSANRINQDALADRYTKLREYTGDLWRGYAQCLGGSSP